MASLTDGQWSAIGQGGAQLLSGAAGLAGAALQYKYNKRLMKQQNQYNIDMWKMQAEYNSPQAQMQRFQQAGLNPNLIYGQGSNGNMNSAPVQGVPAAPELTKGLQEIAKAFNIENLRTIVANRKEAQEKARIAELVRFDKEDERDAQSRLQAKWTYNNETGRYEFRPGGVSVSRKNPRGSRIGDESTAGFFFDKYLSQSDPKLWEQSLKRAYLQPQIQMLRYERENQPYSFWIGQGTKVFNSLSNLVPVFSPLKWRFKSGAQISNSRAFNQNIYRY